MWLEDLSAAVEAVLGSAHPAVDRARRGPRDLLPRVIVPAGRATGAQWALCGPGPVNRAALAALPVVQEAWIDQGRVLLTLTPRAQGRVVGDLLRDHAPALPPGPIWSERAAPDLAALPDLTPVRFAHARTAMLQRQAQGHRMRGPDPDAWSGQTPPEPGPGEERVLVLLAVSHHSRVRARLQHRSAPVVAHLRTLSAAFQQWFAQNRCTPRGPGPASSSIMETYERNLALGAAVGVALRRGLHDLSLDAPENL